MMQIWWERVPNALSFINGIVDSLAQEKVFCSSTLLSCHGLLNLHLS